jgi:hypothetical protein
VLDTKSIMQFVLNAIEQRIIEIAIRFNQMCGQCDFGGAHRPDMQVVDFT